MPTERQRINNANKAINKEIYGTEDGNVKRDDNSLENKLKKIKNTNFDVPENGEMLDIVTKIISDYDYSRSKSIHAKDDSRKEVLNSFNELFNDEDINKDIDRISRYLDYRIIDKYIAEVADAIDVLRDSIMSSDDLTKRSTLYYYKGNLNDDLRKDFEINMEKLFDKYNFHSFVSEKIRSTLLLGDGFNIVGSMSKEFSKILNENHFPEITDDGKVLTEETAFTNNDKYDNLIRESFNSRIDHSIIQSSKISSEEYQKMELKYIEKTKEEVVNAINKNVTFVKEPEKVLLDKMQYGSDSLNKLSEKTRKKLLDINGTHFKDVEPEDMIKLEVDHVCIGYLYINRLNDKAGSFNVGNTNPSGSMLTALTTVTNPDSGSAASYSQSFNIGSSNKFSIDRNFTKNGNTALEYDTLVDMIIDGISNKIDNKFIEKNEHVSDLILALVKADYILNKEIQITFLEPEMVHHVKIDSLKTYGKSVLDSSLFYAKLYLASLITSMMVKINQGRDRRIFYVDTDMDADIEGNIEQLIRDIKSKEVPSDLFSGGTSINTVLNSVGSLDNYYVPTVNGERAFDFDIYSGMESNMDDELLDKLLKSTIIGIGVPYNYIEATQDIDFARSLSMQNQGFVKKVVNYQNKFGTYFTEMIQKMYEYEYGKTEHDKKRDAIIAEKREKGEEDYSEDDHTDYVDPEQIFIRFPEPLLLSVTTSNEQIEAITPTIEFIASNFLPSEDLEGEKGRIFKKELAENVFLRNHDWNLYKETFDKAMINFNKDKLKLKDNEEEEETY